MWLISSVWFHWFHFLKVNFFTSSYKMGAGGDSIWPPCTSLLPIGKTSLRSSHLTSPRTAWGWQVATIIYAWETKFDVSSISYAPGADRCFLEKEGLSFYRGSPPGQGCSCSLMYPQHPQALRKCLLGGWISCVWPEFSGHLRACVSKRDGLSETLDFPFSWPCSQTLSVRVHGSHRGWLQHEAGLVLLWFLTRSCPAPPPALAPVTHAILPGPRVTAAGLWERCHPAVFWGDPTGGQAAQLPPCPGCSLCRLRRQEPPRTVLGTPVPGITVVMLLAWSLSPTGLATELPSSSLAACRNHFLVPWQTEKNQINPPAERLPGVLTTASSETAQLPSPGREAQDSGSAGPGAARPEAGTQGEKLLMWERKKEKARMDKRKQTFKHL